MIFNKKLWMIVWLSISIIPHDVYSSDDEEKNLLSPSSHLVPEKTKKRSRDDKVPKDQRETKKSRPSIGTALKQEQSQIYAIPTYDGTFKYLMNDPEICRSFLRSFIPDQKIKSIRILDDHLSPFKKHQRARAFVNDANSKKVINKMKTLLKGKDVTDQQFYISFENARTEETNNISGGKKFLKELVSIYGDILEGYPLPQRNSQVDLLCEVDNNYYALVEVQVVPQNFWDKRALFYASSIYAHQLSEGEDWKDIKKVICINLLGGGPKNTKWLDQAFKIFTVKDQYDHEIKDGIEIRQYPLFYQEIRQDKDLMTQLTKQGKQEYLEWLDFFEGAHDKKEKDVKKIKSTAVKKAYDLIKVSKLPKAVAAENLDQDNEVFDPYSDYTEHLKNQAKEEGIQEGIEKGLEKGKSEAFIEMALKMRDEGYSEDQIIKMTELSFSDLEAIKQRNVDSQTETKEPKD